MFRYGLGISAQHCIEPYRTNQKYEKASTVLDRFSETVVVIKEFRRFNIPLLTGEVCLPSFTY